MFAAADLSLSQLTTLAAAAFLPTLVIQIHKILRGRISFRLFRDLSAIMIPYINDNGDGMMRILFVEDDKELCDAIKLQLEQAAAVLCV